MLSWAYNLANFVLWERENYFRPVNKCKNTLGKPKHVSGMIWLEQKGLIASQTSKTCFLGAKLQTSKWTTLAKSKRVVWGIAYFFLDFKMQNLGIEVSYGLQISIGRHYGPFRSFFGLCLVFWHSKVKTYAQLIKVGKICNFFGSGWLEYMGCQTSKLLKICQLRSNALRNRLIAFMYTSNRFWD